MAFIIHILLGISYSYAYEEFQKTFEHQNKPKSSTVYQKLLNELNFFKRKEKKEIVEKEAKEYSNVSTPLKETISHESESQKIPTLKKYCSNATIDFSDNETISDVNESVSSRHLSSPKRKPKKPHHYSLQQLHRPDDNDQSDTDCPKYLRRSSSSSKASLINRFLRNVTIKKMLDLKVQRKQKSCHNYLSLYVKGAKPNRDVNKRIDIEIETEIIKAKEQNLAETETLDQAMLRKITYEVLRDSSEKLLKVPKAKSVKKQNVW